MLLVLQLECIKQALLLTVYCTQLSLLTLYFPSCCSVPFLTIELKRKLENIFFLTLLLRFAHLFTTNCSQQISSCLVRSPIAVTQHYEYSLMGRHSDMSNVHSGGLCHLEKVMTQTQMCPNKTF